jgi:CRP/FNR family cyclic AMP-dependent transcriptional regulator
MATEPAYVRLLDIEPELASRLRDDDRAEARERLTALVIAIPKGDRSLPPEQARTRPVGLVVVDGLLLQEVRLAGRRSLQLLGRGDVVLPGGASGETLEVELGWVAAVDTRVALLDDHLQGPLALWPGLALGLLDRVAHQLARAATQAAIAQLPRVEDRLEATFWDLAGRWGRVTPSGVHVPLQLTHETLAQLVGGRRPTISLALSALAERGLVMRRPDGSWLVIADRPTLAPNDDDGAPLPVTPLPAPEAVPMRHAPEPWLPAVREELLATARRVADEHVRAAERVSADRLRYQATRQRSEQLRAEAARQRAERRAEREVRGIVLNPLRPDAPSG